MKSRLAVLMAAFVLVACGGAGEPTPPGGNTGPTGSTGGTGGTGGTGTTGGGGGGGGGSTSSQVTVGDNYYSPNNTTVAVNTTVTWTWAESYTSHSVNFNNSDIQSEPPRSSGTISRQFTVAGTYTYFCSVHGNAMSGQIVVTP